MSLTGRERQEEAETAAQATQDVQLEELACNYQGWYIKHEAYERVRYQKVVADTINVFITGYERALNGTAGKKGRGGTRKLPIGDVDRYIAQYSDGSISPATHAWFLVVGVPVHPDILDAVGVNASHLILRP